MRRSSALYIGLTVAALWLISGWRFDALPFNPGARYSDAVTSHFPAAWHIYYHADSLHWRETIMAGAPFAANPLHKTAYPPQWLALIVPPILHLNLLIIFHLALGAWGMWRWTRSVGLRGAATLIGAAGFIVSPRVIGHLGAGHLDLVYALAWLPVLMWSVYAWLRRQASILPVALSASLLVLADTRLSLFALPLAVGYALVLARRDVRRLLEGGVRIAPICALLTAGLLAALNGWQPYLSRAALTPQDAGIFSLEAVHLIGLILPAHGGNIETLTYVGLPVFVLALVGIVTRRREVMGWGAAVVLAVWYALGVNGGLWTSLVESLPFLLWFRVPSRAWLLVAVLMPLLAAYGADALIGRLERGGMSVRLRSRWRLLTVVIAGAGTMIGLAAWIALPVPDSAAIALLVGSLGLGLVILWGTRTGVQPRRIALGLLLLVLIDGAWTGRAWLEWRSQTAWLTDSQRQIAEALIEFGAGRIYSPSYSLEQSTAEIYGLRLFGGVDPFQIASVSEAIQRAGGVTSAGYSVVQPPLSGVIGDDPATANRAAKPDTALLAAWGVTHVVSAYPLEIEGLTFLREIDAVMLYAVTAPRPASLRGTIPDWGDQAALGESEVRALLARGQIVGLVSAAGFLAVGLVAVFGMWRRMKRR